MHDLNESTYDMIIKDETIKISYDPYADVSFSDCDDGADEIGN